MDPRAHGPFEQSTASYASQAASWQRACRNLAELPLWAIPLAAEKIIHVSKHRYAQNLASQPCKRLPNSVPSHYAGSSPEGKSIMLRHHWSAYTLMQGQAKENCKQQGRHLCSSRRQQLPICDRSSRELGGTPHQCPPSTVLGPTRTSGAAGTRRLLLNARTSPCSWTCLRMATRRWSRCS